MALRKTSKSPRPRAKKAKKTEKVMVDGIVKDKKKKNPEHTERALVAASRRLDRPLYKRLRSAYAASKVHFERTGKALWITESIVANGEMYEEDDGDMPRFASMGLCGKHGMIGGPGGPTVSELLATSDREWRQNDINRLFAEMFPYADENARRLSQQQSGTLPSPLSMQDSPSFQSPLSQQESPILPSHLSMQHSPSLYSPSLPSPSISTQSFPSPSFPSPSFPSPSFPSPSFPSPSLASPSLLSPSLLSPSFAQLPQDPSSSLYWGLDPNFTVPQTQVDPFAMFGSDISDSPNFGSGEISVGEDFCLVPEQFW